MTITELSIKRPTLVVVVFSFLGVLGIFGYMQLKYDLMPKMTSPFVTIRTIYPGASPSEIENTVTKVLEDAVSGLDKVVTIRSTSMENMSMISIEFETNADVDIVIQDAQRKVNEVAQKLPKDALQPIVSKISFDELPVLRMATSSKLPAKEFYQFIKDRVQPQLSKIKGVGLISLFGGEEREIKVNLDLQKIRGFGLSLIQVANVLKLSNLDFPTGKIYDKDDQLIVRVAGKFSTVGELNELVVGRSRQGGEIRLGDVAEVWDGIKEITNINRLNGASSIGITVQKQSDANTVEVSDKVKKEINRLEKQYSNSGLKFEIAQDNSNFIMLAANAVKEDLGLAILIVAFVMLIFLHSYRNSMIVMVSIPTSLISTFFLMYIFDFSLNMMTLLAMSLVIGILVDDSIVVLENIYRHLEMGKGKREAALAGRNEIGFAALSITFVDIVVFAPMTLITGMIGNFLREYALVVVFSTLMSLFVSFTITPLLASRFTKQEHLGKGTLIGRFGEIFERFFNWLTGFYRSTLSWSLNNGGKIVVLVTLLFISSILLVIFKFIGFEFIPVIDRGEMVITIELEPGSSIANTNYYAAKVEKILWQFPEVEKVLANVGISSEGFIGTASNQHSEFAVTLVDKHKRKDATDVIGQKIKARILELPGIKVRINPVSLMGTQNRSPVQMRISGPEYEEVYSAADIIEDAIKSIPGTTDVRLSSESGKPELKVEIDRKKMSALGLTIFDVGMNLRIALTGDNDSKFREGDNEYDIRIMLDDFDRTNITSVGNLSFMNNKGQQVELKQFARIYQSTGPTKLEREDRIAAITLYSMVFGKTSGIIADEIAEKLKNVKLPEGVRWEFTGEQKTMRESTQSLIWALLAGILFVYMIMIALYNSYLYPFVVLFSIPLAIIGAFYGLALTGKSISIYSMLGIIMLVGLVAKNAILIVDRTNQMKTEKSMSTSEALLEAGQTRLRPILMTTFAMIFGMMPIALSTSAGSEAKSGLAVVLIGGLASSLFLTLLLVPVVYQRVDKWKSAIGLKK